MNCLHRGALLSVLAMTPDSPNQFVISVVLQRRGKVSPEIPQQASWTHGILINPFNHLTQFLRFTSDFLAMSGYCK